VREGQCSHVRTAEAQWSRSGDPQFFLNFLPLPQGHRSFWPTADRFSSGPPCDGLGMRSYSSSASARMSSEISESRSISRSMMAEISWMVRLAASSASVSGLVSGSAKKDPERGVRVVDALRQDEAAPDDSLEEVLRAEMEARRRLGRLMQGVKTRPSFELGVEAFELFTERISCRE